jgi:hypothetical protein
MLENVIFPLGDGDLNKVFNSLVHAKMQLWIIGEFNAVLITEIKESSCILHMINGNGMADWQDEVISTIELWALQIGCTKMVVMGRKGWEKIGKQYGYYYAYTALQKELNHAR